VPLIVLVLYGGRVTPFCGRVPDPLKETLPRVREIWKSTERQVLGKARTAGKQMRYFN